MHRLNIISYFYIYNKEKERDEEMDTRNRKVN